MLPRLTNCLHVLTNFLEKSNQYKTTRHRKVFWTREPPMHSGNDQVWPRASANWAVLARGFPAPGLECACTFGIMSSSRPT
eukprot:38166-Amphidinium_carterae.1